jgi:hypothetical protein
VDGEHRDRVAVLPGGLPGERFGRQPVDRLVEMIDRLVEDLAGRLDGGVGHQAGSRPVT